MYAYVDGEFLTDTDAKVSVFDHGLVTGDGAFETIAIYDNVPFAITRHLQRLNNTLVGMRLAEPDLERLESAISQLVAMNDLGNAKLRITYTAGDSGLGSDRAAGTHRLVLAMEPVSYNLTGATKVAVSPWPRNERGVLAGLKTTSYAENVIALDYAHAKGASEVIFANTKGELCEGSGSNIFVVCEGEVVTPSLSSGCLAGVTRALLVERFGVKELDIPMEWLTNGRVSEAFLSSSIREVQPIEWVDEYRLPDIESRVTKELAHGFAELKARDLNP